MHNTSFADWGLHRYVITDYDNKNFTVAQAIFDEKSEPHVVPIPWNATVTPTTSNRPSRNAIIGISIGSVAFTLLIAIIYFVMRRRKDRAVAASNDAVMPVLESSEPRPFSNISIQEIGPQIVRELHATSHHIELLDRQAPSGSGMQIKELPGWSKDSPPALPSTALKDHSTLAERDRVESLANIRGTEEEPSINSATRNSNISILSLNLGTHRATSMKKDTMESGRVSIKSWKKPSKVNKVTKALPPAPLAERQSRQKHSSCRSHASDPNAESIRMLPVSRIIARALPAQEKDSVAVDPRVSPTYASPTYATVFNVEAYQDSPAHSPALSSTYRPNKTT